MFVLNEVTSPVSLSLHNIEVDPKGRIGCDSY